jgi:hypothetical protein
MLGALCELHNETECAILQRLFHMGNVNAKAVKVFFSNNYLFHSIFFKDNQTALSIAVENQHRDRDMGVLIYAHLNFSRLADTNTTAENSVNI